MAKLLVTLLHRSMFVLLILQLSATSYADQNLDENVLTDVVETLNEAPSVVEDLVLTPQKGFLASPWFLGTLIFSLTFFIEEVAIAASAYLMGSERISYSLGFFTLFMGIFISDFFLYLIGVVVSRSRWIQSYVDVSYYQKKVTQYLDKGLWITIIVARIIPGMLIPIFFILGFTKASIKKIGFVNLFVTCIYTLVVLYLILFVGLKISEIFGAEIILALVLLLSLYLLRDRIWNFIRTEYYLLRAQKAKPWIKETHIGMPPLLIPRKLTFFEWLPGTLTYIPIMFAYIFYAIRFRSVTYPIAVNPGIENSGICGESKSKILSSFPSHLSEFIPRYVVIKCEEQNTTEKVMELLNSNSLNFPLVAKPDIGYMSRGVELISDEAALNDYMERFPRGQKILLQEYLSSDGEAGVFYVRCPNSEKFKIKVALTYFPFVTGDGRRSVSQLLRDDPRFAYFSEAFKSENKSEIIEEGRIVRLKMSGSTKDGSIHTFLESTEGSQLEKVIHEISCSIPEFWMGRFDVKFSKLEDLLQGRFKILELNGASGEDLTAWDANKGVLHCYRTLFEQIKWLFVIGRINKRRGLASVSGANLIKAFVEQESILFRLTRAKYSAMD